MTEFALALPLLAAVLAILWFVGWAHMRKQRVLVAGRHAVQLALTGRTLSDSEINDDLLAGAAESVDPQWRGGDTGELDDWVDWVGGRAGPSPGTLAQRTIIDLWPQNRGVRLDVEYTSPIAVGAAFDNSLAVGHRQAGDPWVHGQTSQYSALRDLYYDGLDAELRAIQGPGVDLAQRIRSLYMGGW